MEPTEQSILKELKGAAIDGIRERGAEAFGQLLIGLVRLLLAAAFLLVLYVAGATMFDFDLVSTPFAAASVMSMGVGFLATRGRQWGGGSEAPTQDDHRPLRPDSPEPSGIYARMIKMFNPQKPG
jgi:hypothetical protein